ncbi:MAG: TonB-dependent receptor [Kofleriaceae bacterium]
MKRAGFLAMLLAANAFADDDAHEDVAGETIVVTGTKSEEPISATPISTEVIDRKELESSGVQSVGEALALRPGMYIDRGVAGTSGLNLQGLGPQYSLILVDGARQIGRTDGYLDLDRFGIADIEQIEIVRGPSSALYGADALGGVVDIITRTPKDGLAVDALSRVDGRGAYEERARIAFGTGGVAGAVSGELRDTPAVRRGDPAAVATTLDAANDKHVTGRVTDTQMDNWRLDGTADYLQRDLRGVDASATGAVFDRRNLDESASFGGRARYTGEATAIQLAADGSLYRDQYLYDQRLSDALDEYQVTDESLVEMSAQVAHDFGRHRVAVGGEGLREALDSDRLSEPGSRERGAVYAQDEWRVLGSDALVVVPAARIDGDTQFGSHVTPHLALRYAVDDVVLRVGAGTGYRAPDFKELLLHFENPSVGYVVDGNPDLKPETSRSAQGGIEWRANGWLWLSGNAYVNDLHDMIYAVTEPMAADGTLQFSYANIGRARTSGAEATAMITHGAYSLTAGYAFTHAWDFDSHRALEGMPAHRATAIARYRSESGLDGFIAAVATGHRPFYLSDDPTLATNAPRRFELRARIAKRFKNGFGGFMGIDNALDTGDATLDRLPPRTVYAGVEAHL